MFGRFRGLGGFGVLEDLGLSPELVTIVPPVAGAATAFAATAAVKYFVSSTSKWYQYAGLIGALASLVPAVALYKYQNKGAAMAAAGAGIVTGLALWLLPKIEAAAVTKAMSGYAMTDPVPLLQGYTAEQAVPLLQGTPELLSGAPDILSGGRPEVMSGYNPAFV